MRWLHFGLVAAFALLGVCSSSRGHAKPGAELSLEVSPILGAGAPLSGGWFGVVARVESPSGARFDGTLELRSRLAWGSDAPLLLTRAAFSVVDRVPVSIQLLSHGMSRAPPSVTVVALDRAGKELQKVELAPSHGGSLLLFDWSVPSRVGSVLRGRLLFQPSTTRSYSYGSVALSVSSPETNPRSGAVIVPHHAAGYAPATLVLSQSDELAQRSEAELSSLGDWLLSGGALAVVVTRPEDLRGRVLSALCGGPPSFGPSSDDLGGPEVFQVPPETPTKNPPPSFSPGASGVLKRIAPSEAVRSSLVGFRGGNLKDSPWGASASYGLGEVHLLAFNPTTEPYASDEWVQAKLIALVQHAARRSETIALPHARDSFDATGVSSVRRELDPNEGTRWTVAVSALLLLIYAVLVGPLNFYFAARRGKPLAALWHLPVWAAITSSIVIVLGIVSKGLEGRARHLTLIEAGAGLSRAAAVRFRGFYAASSDILSVSPWERGGVLDVLEGEEFEGRALVLDRHSLKLEGLRAKPWETVLVREDGFIGLGGGVSLVEDEQGELRVINRSARDLIGVIVNAPGRGARYFPRIEDGGRVALAQGTPLSGAPGTHAMAAPSLNSAWFSSVVDKDVVGVGEAWRVIENLIDSSVHFWPSDVPVLIAQIEGGEGRHHDSGLTLDQDRVLLRVVGYGGVL